MRKRERGKNEMKLIYKALYIYIYILFIFKIYLQLMNSLFVKLIFTTTTTTTTRKRGNRLIFI